MNHKPVPEKLVHHKENQNSVNDKPIVLMGLNYQDYLIHVVSAYHQQGVLKTMMYDE